MLRAPASFGMDSSVDVIKFAFFSVGLWWAVFLLPLVLFVPETQKSSAGLRRAIGSAFRELRGTISHIRQYNNIVKFLGAYWLYIGGVFTVISMAANYGQRLGFEDSDLVLAFMITNLAGFPATLLYGLLGKRFGARKGIYLALSIYVVVSCWAVFMTEIRQFFVMAIIVGCIQGGVQGLSRSYYATLIPKGQPGEFFGFYNMMTKFSHVIGPMVVGVSAMLSDSPAIVLIVLLPLFIGGGLLLMRVD